jgi:hypothetical protein
VDPFLRGRLGICWGERIATSYNRKYAPKIRFVKKRSPDIGDDIPSRVDYVFLDGDHSLEGIAADWSFWSGRIASKGIIALHDTLISPNSRNVLGSHMYFKSHISQDIRFTLVEQQDSLSVLERTC